MGYLVNNKFLISILILLSSSVAAQNMSNDSFSKAKRMLEKQVYSSASERKTIYCSAHYDQHKHIQKPPGFSTTKYVKRAKKVEWEHVVPAENFGRNFIEWREGNKRCINSKGKAFKGRHCAEKMNKQYRYMQADMFNLYPAIGAVNALRSNHNFVMLDHGESSFGRCDMQIKNKKAQPPVAARGIIARSYLYMDKTYKNYAMSSAQKKLMNAWNKQYPVSKWECKRNKRISALQHSRDSILDNSCHAAGY